MPGKVAGFLRTTELEPAERVALDQGVTVRRGQRYTLRVSAVPAVHCRFLDPCRPLDGTPGAPAIPSQRKACRAYENRVNTPLATVRWLSRQTLEIISWRVSGVSGSCPFTAVLVLAVPQGLAAAEIVRPAATMPPAACR
ncbi:hypothetical protein [Streptomyces sp. WM6372]|uniref:hypothetical protein n=1 Tax=Streptomyces sp. WM6372 TaxID=1415555 RepID=UPI000B3204A5|nr:hypothetical protein [Streptomyces sp. WM6372]